MYKDTSYTLSHGRSAHALVAASSRRRQAAAASWLADLRFEIQLAPSGRGGRVCAKTRVMVVRWVLSRELLTVNREWKCREKWIVIALGTYIYRERMPIQVQRGGRRQ